jgi:hypothetical protein
MEDISTGIFMDTGSILRPFDVFYDHLVYFLAIWYIVPHVGLLHKENSGNPGQLGPLA